MKTALAKAQMLLLHLDVESTPSVLLARTFGGDKDAHLFHSNNAFKHKQGRLHSTQRSSYGFETVMSCTLFCVCFLFKARTFNPRRPSDTPLNAFLVLGKRKKKRHKIEILLGCFLTEQDSGNLETPLIQS